MHSSNFDGPHANNRHFDGTHFGARGCGLFRDTREPGAPFTFGTPWGRAPDCARSRYPYDPSCDDNDVSIACSEATLRWNTARGPIQIRIRRVGQKSTFNWPPEWDYQLTGDLTGGSCTWRSKFPDALEAYDAWRKAQIRPPTRESPATFGSAPVRVETRFNTPAPKPTGFNTPTPEPVGKRTSHVFAVPEVPPKKKKKKAESVTTPTKEKKKKKKKKKTSPQEESANTPPKEKQEASWEELVKDPYWGSGPMPVDQEKKTAAKSRVLLSGLGTWGWTETMTARAKDGTAETTAADTSAPSGSTTPEEVQRAMWENDLDDDDVDPRYVTRRYTA